MWSIVMGVAESFVSRLVMRVGNVGHDTTR